MKRVLYFYERKRGPSIGSYRGQLLLRGGPSYEAIQNQDGTPADSELRPLPEPERLRILIFPHTPA